MTFRAVKPIDGTPYGPEDLDPTLGKQYVFSVPKFTSPLTKVIKLKMVAYSGGSCFDEVTKDIVLLASPVVVFNSLNSVCLNNGSVQFSANETSGLMGSGIFKGNGISRSRFFQYPF